MVFAGPGSVPAVNVSTTATLYPVISTSFSAIPAKAGIQKALHQAIYNKKTLPSNFSIKRTFGAILDKIKI